MWNSPGAGRLEYSWVFDCFVGLEITTNSKNKNNTQSCLPTTISWTRWGSDKTISRTATYTDDESLQPARTIDELLRGNQYPFPSENDKVTTQFHWWKRRELSIGRKGVRPFCHEDHSATLQTISAVYRFQVVLHRLDWGRWVIFMNLLINLSLVTIVLKHYYGKCGKNIYIYIFRSK